MKLKSLQISNIWSFRHFESIEDAPKIVFDKNFNILIGQNGAGKSTVLEVINFVFKRVLFVPYNRNRDLYSQKTTIDPNQKRTILAKMDNVQYYRGFRLERNYDFENQTQNIRIMVELDDIDEANIKLLQDNREKLATVLGQYSNEQMFPSGPHQNEYQIDIALDAQLSTYRVNSITDAGSIYLMAYNLYKEAIELYNEENREDIIENLSETFALIGSYRNYSVYETSASLSGTTADRQIQQLKSNEYSKSTNTAEFSEPTIFGLVRFRMAGEIYNLMRTRKDEFESQTAANELSFVKSINEKLVIVNLKIEIELIDMSTWRFAFSFRDLRRNRSITDISSLSAGQKAIVHLVFEAYGRGNIKGGLVIIDEPEIHLHYQFQYEYLRVINKLNSEQGSQYILVTHSESLISSETIESVIRVSLDDHNYSRVNQPDVQTPQKWLVKMLDNVRSTHAFFGSKVLLVEGETDRYFFRALISEIEEKLKKGIAQDITVLDIEGKGKVDEWRQLFDSFGLKTYLVADLDHAYKFYQVAQPPKINTEALAKDFLTNYPDAIQLIEQEYSKDTFILKEGDLEFYLGIHQKGLPSLIRFCHSGLRTFFDNLRDSRTLELRAILAQITGENAADL